MRSITSSLALEIPFGALDAVFDDSPLSSQPMVAFCFGTGTFFEGIVGERPDHSSLEAVRVQVFDEGHCFPISLLQPPADRYTRITYAAIPP